MTLSSAVFNAPTSKGPEEGKSVVRSISMERVITILISAPEAVGTFPVVKWIKPVVPEVCATLELALLLSAVK